MIITKKKENFEFLNFPILSLVNVGEKMTIDLRLSADELPKKYFFYFGLNNGLSKKLLLYNHTNVDILCQHCPMVFWQVKTNILRIFLFIVFKFQKTRLRFHVRRRREHLSGEQKPFDSNARVAIRDDVERANRYKRQCCLRKISIRSRNGKTYFFVRTSSYMLFQTKKKVF